MKIEGTELEFDSGDVICCEYWIGEEGESMQEHAVRLWENCKRAEKGLETCILGNKLASVYKKRSAKSLWEEYKRHMRNDFVKKMSGSSCHADLLKVECINEDIKGNHECKWPESHAYGNIALLKEDKRYENGVDRDIKIREKQEKELEENQDSIKKHVSKLKQKFDDETIAIIYPKGERYLGSKSNGIPAVGKK